MPRRSAAAAVATAVAALAATAAAQSVATALIVGGEFRAAGDQTGLQNIVQWDGRAWSRLAGLPLGEGIVWSLAVYDQQLIAAGRYDLAGTDFVNNIAAFDGFTWRPLGSGLELILTPQYDVDVQAMLVFKNTLIAAGYFDTAGGVRASNIAQWDGASWAPLGEGVSNEVHALTIYNNNLIAGGEFVNAGGVQVRYIAQWDGTVWSALADGVTMPNAKVYALIVYNGLLVVGGDFDEVSGLPVSNIATWNGSSWAALGAGVSSPVGPRSAQVNGFTLFRGDLILAGRFQAAGGSQANRVARWDGAAYYPLGNGLNDESTAIVTYEDNVIVGGRFNAAGGQPINQLAQWDGANWSDLGFAAEYDSYTWFHAFQTVAVAGTPGGSKNGQSGVTGECGVGGVWVAATRRNPGFLGCASTGRRLTPPARPPPLLLGALPPTKP